MSKRQLLVGKGREGGMGGKEEGEGSEVQERKDSFKVICSHFLNMMVD